jgi:hypothetical protein
MIAKACVCGHPTRKLNFVRDSKAIITQRSRCCLKAKTFQEKAISSRSVRLALCRVLSVQDGIFHLPA